MVLATHAATKDAIEHIAGGVAHEVLEDSSFEVEDSVYDLPFRVQVGYGASYQSEVFTEQHSATNLSGPLPTAAGHTVHRAMVRYGITRDIDVQFNVNNIFDKQYLTRVRTAGDQAWATPGERRQFVLTASYHF